MFCWRLHCPPPQANKDYASALLFAIDKGDVTLDRGAQLATLDKKLMPHLISNKIQRWEP